MRATFFVVALIALLGRALYERAQTVGAFRKPNTFHAAGEIKVIPDTINAEDLHLDHASGLIFAAAHDKDGGRSKWFPPLTRFGEPQSILEHGGGLRVIDPKTFTTTRLELKGFDAPFSTHGIDTVRDPEQQDAIYILAVNHLPTTEYLQTLDATAPVKAASRIEIFHHVIGTDIATHVRSVEHDLVKMPNDIFAISPFAFYVTNDHHYREGPLRTVEVLGTKRFAGWSTTVYVEADETKNGADGVQAKVALTGLHNNNGLGHTPNVSTILINDAAGGVTYTARIKEDRTLEVVHEFPLPITIDNPFWFTDPYPSVDHDASGVVNAGLTQGIKLEKELDIAEGAIAPSVFLTSGLGRGQLNTTLLFEDDGNVLRSASAAVLIAIDPKENEGKKQGWLFVSGFASKAAVAVKVDL